MRSQTLKRKYIILVCLYFIRKAPLAVFFTSFGPTKVFVLRKETFLIRQKKAFKSFIIHSNHSLICSPWYNVLSIQQTMNLLTWFIKVIASWFMISSIPFYIYITIRTNEKEIPFIKDLFIDIQNRYDASFYGYLNSDILFDDTIISTLQSVHIAIQNKQIKKKVFWFFPTLCSGSSYRTKNKRWFCQQQTHSFFFSLSLLHSILG